MIGQKIKGFINYSKRIYIKINLGYDELKEIDILRLISRNIEKEYRNFRKLSVRRFLTKFFKFVFIFFFVGVLFYYTPIYNLNNSLKKSISVESYFPSQVEGTLYSTDDKTDSLTIKIENKSILSKICIYCDIFVYVLYQGFKWIIPLKPIRLKELLSLGVIHENFHIIPVNIDYLFWIYFLIFYFFIKYYAPRIIGAASDVEILKNLKELNETIEYHISDERAEKAGLTVDLFGFSRSRRKIRNQPKADIREIEKRLIEILGMFDSYNRFSVKPEFICIFDELDKIEPYENISLLEKEEEELKTFGQMETTFFASEGIRRRQHTIFKILSNLKHFLNTAKAKFIFIAGREMYDAALADVSDRNFFIGTIFHDVIYVHSFLTDASDNKASDISSMTEQYICQFLFPLYYDVEDFSLMEYKKFLDLYFEKGDTLNVWDEQLRIQKIGKIIVTLRNFITYLTYRSNGAPKKITAYFENYIYKPELNKNKEDSELNSDFSLCVGFNTRNLYLAFDYYDQYTFDMLAYLVNPVILAISKSVKDFGDKLLVSTSFLVDHLYKFHRNAFSWRNIELTPEILDINKAPQLRELIGLIMENLSNGHIVEIVSGLFNFRFRKKISEEISFLSKVSEKEAAAFNFTLDESLLLKKHHKKLLRELKNNFLNSKHNPEFINSISFAHMIIGDLHFYDEEYNDAIIEYMEAVENLRSYKFDASNASYFLLLIRNMLKLGYTLEKRKSYVSAFMIYSQLVTHIIKFREIDLKDFGLKEKRIARNSLWDAFEKKAYNKKFIVEPEKEDVKPEADKKKAKDITVEKDVNINRENKFLNVLVKDDDIKIFDNLFLQWGKSSGKLHHNLRFDEEIQLEELDFYNDTPVSLSDDFVELINRAPFSSKKEDTMLNMSTFEGIRLLYQPLVARLQIIEKAHLAGITLVDLKRIEIEYRFMAKLIKQKEKHLVEAEFWSKIGDILYFKNGLLPANLFDHLPEVKGANNDSNYCAAMNALCCESIHVKKLVNRAELNVPCRACYYYMKSLKTLCLYQLDMTGKETVRETLLSTIFFKLKTRQMSSQNVTALRVIGKTFSKIGDSFLSCCSKDILPGDEFLSRFLDFVEDPVKRFRIFFEQKGELVTNGPLAGADLESVTKNPRKFNKLEEVFIYYFFSYYYYVGVGQSKEGAVQVLKILYLIRNVIRVKSSIKTKITSLLKKIGEVLLERGIKHYYRGHGSVHRLEIEDYKNIFNYDNQREDEGIKLTNISLNANLKELIITFEEIKLDCGESDIFKNPREFLKYFPVTPYSTLNRMYNRIVELKFKARVNFEIFKKLRFDEIVFKDLKGEFKSESLIEQRVDELLYQYGIDAELLNSFFKFSENDDIKEKVFLAVEFLIIDSIFCFQEIIKLVGIYGVTYMVSYSILAHAHKRMGDWCNFYFSYFRNSSEERQKRIKRDLINLINIDNLQYIGTRFHYEKAMDAYYSILELHREGKTYRNMIEKMFYLNDDFDDQVYQFGAAAERYRINIGRIKENQENVRKKLSGSTIYNYKKYL
jgi:hypothetical protein